MQTAGCLTVEVDLMFPTAAVGFTVNIGPERTAEGVPLRIRPRALVEGKRPVFRKRRISGRLCGGLCRWLGTKRVTAVHTEITHISSAIYRAANARHLAGTLSNAGG